MPAKKRVTRRKRTMPPRDPRTGAFRKRTTRRARPARKPATKRAKRRVTARRNPAVSRSDAEFYIVYRHPEKGPFYFDGEFMTNTIKRAAFYKDRTKAHHIAQKIAEAINRPIAVHST